jgi:hypothetical protein
MGRLRKLFSRFVAASDGCFFVMVDERIDSFVIRGFRSIPGVSRMAPGRQRGRG